MRALLVHSSEEVLSRWKVQLGRQLPCDAAHSVAEVVARLAEREYGLVLLEHDPPANDALAVLTATLAGAPSALVIVMADAATDSRVIDERGGERVFRFEGRADSGGAQLLQSTVAAARRVARLERQQRDLVRRIGEEHLKLQKRERLLDVVVRERTKELEVSYERLKTANRQALLALAEAIEAKDAYTKGHCGRVAAYTMALAHACNYPSAELETLEFAAFLHDIGKIGIRDAVLLKPAALDEEEWKHMKIHPSVGDQIASQSELLQPMRPAIRNHHERWDGNGYPDRMKAEAIPLSARIVCITDAFDAMVTERPYKKALSLAESVFFLRKGQGTQFDPELVELWVERRLGELFVSG